MRTLRNLFLTAATLICSAAATWAQTTFENEAGTLKFKITNSENHYVSVSKGTNTPSGDIEIPSEATDPESGTPYTVTSIGSSAFKDCTGLTSVIIPEGVKSIGSSAFKGCTGLTSVIIPEGVTSIGSSAFSGCIGLTSVTIPNSVTSIDNSAFYNCSKLASINIPEGVTSIKNYTFSNCSNLTSINIPESVTSIGDQAFYFCRKLASINIPESVTSIGFQAFFYCSKLASINIPESVTSIGDQAFDGCSSLQRNEYGNAIYIQFGENPYLLLEKVKSTNITECEINSKCKLINSATFNGCSGLTSITIPSSVLTIGENAFGNCTNLTKVTINSDAIASKKYSESNNLKNIFGAQVTEYVFGESVTAIGWYALYNCSDITSVTFSGTSQLETIGRESFRGCSSLASINIPDGVTSINSYAFIGCAALESVTFPESVISIGNQAFLGCASLTSVTIPSNVTTIEYAAFSNCTNLTKVTINSDAIASKTYDMNNSNLKTIFGTQVTEFVLGEDITAIGDYAFYGCSGLSSITIPENATTIGEQAFRSCTNLASVTFSDASKLETIGGKAFYDCSGLTSLTIPEGVTSISSEAFYRCSALTSVTFPDGIKSIGDYAFCSTGLTSVTIPESVESIGNYAFSSCTNVTEFVFENATPPTFGTDVFNYTTCPIYVPNAAALRDYKQADNMSSYADRIQVKPIVVDGVKYQLQEDGTCTVVANDYSGDVVIRGSVDYNGVETDVTSISDNAFKDCTNLTSVTFSGTSKLQTIGDNAFYGCSGLTSLTIPKGVTSIGISAFQKCTGLTSVTIPGSVTTIGHSAFQICSSLTSITIPNSVTSINEYTFRNCTSLSSVSIPESVTSIGYEAFQNCSGLTSINIPNNVTSISANAFYGCRGLTSVTVSESVESIGNGAFQNCSGLISINIPNNVTSIGADAFNGCSELTSVTIGNSVATIGSSAFSGCTNIAKVTINSNAITSKTYNTFSNLSKMFEGSAIEYVFGENITAIGDYAFYNCTNVKEYTFENAIAPTFGSYAFYNITCPIYVPTAAAITDYKQTCGYPNLVQVRPIVVDGVKYQLQEDGTCIVLANDYSGDVVIRGSVDYNGLETSVTAISSDAFKNCSDLTSITISEGITLVPEDAFLNCTSLSSVSIPDGVTSIGINAFYGCTSLTSVTIPESVTTIGYRAFQNCSSLASITIPEGVTTINGCAFSGCTSLTEITIPESVTTIEERVFKDCNSLETVYFNAKNCTKMGYDDYTFAFTGCTSVTTIIIGENVETIPRTAFKNCTGLKTLTIPASVTTIGNYAFEGCNEIETLTFNSDAIGYNFNNNANLKTLNIGNSVTSISDYAFRNCTGLTSINIPEGVTSIGNSAFEGCTGIKSVTIPASVTTFGDDAFKDCNGIETLTYNTDAIGARFCNNPMLKTVNIGEAVTKIGNYTFSGCTGLTTITIPSNVTSIGEYAFKNCTGFTSIVVPNTVTSIGKCAFYGCSNLTKITLPFVGGKHYTAEDASQLPFGYIFGYTPLNWNQLSPFTGSTTIQSFYIGDETNGYYFYIPSGLREVVITGSSYIQPYAFNNCSMLTSITIPESVTSVGEQAFRYTDSDIIFEGATPPSFGEYVFENSSSYSTYPIYVPTEEAVEAYKAAENMQSDLSDYRNRVMVNPYCKVTVVANNSDYGTVSGSGTYNRTTTPTVTITATAAENYSFVCWAEDGATEASHEITLSGAATYTAIFKRTVTISNVVAENKEYNGNAEAAISYDVDGLLDADDVTVTPTAAFADANAGTGKVVDYSFELSGNDADNYVFAEGSQSGTTTADITPVLVSEPVIVLSATEFTYNGEAQTPTVTVKNGETVIAAAEYEVSFSDDVTNAGEKTVTVSNIAGNYTVNGSATYSINPAAEAPNKPEATMETRCINTEFVELPENWQWTENKALVLGDNTATVEYTGADAGNYLIESVDIAITRLGCEHTEGVDILNALESTCTAEGYTGDQRCKICGEIIATGETTTANGHAADSVAFENIVEATRTAAGSYDSVVYCSVCKVELSRTTVEVPQILAETIKLASNPNKVEYKQGEKLDVKGGKITIGYSDKSTEDFEILAGWVSGFDSQKVGEQKLTVTFESVSSTLTTTFNVTVSKEDDNTAIDEASANAVNIYAYQNVIVVENAADEIDIYNAMGALVCRDAARHVSTATGLGARTEIRMNTAGIYIVKVGNVAKRVMIND